MSCKDDGVRGKGITKDFYCLSAGHACRRLALPFPHPVSLQAEVCSLLLGAGQCHPRLLHDAQKARRSRTTASNKVVNFTRNRRLEPDWLALSAPGHIFKHEQRLGEPRHPCAVREIPLRGSNTSQRHFFSQGLGGGRGGDRVYKQLLHSASQPNHSLLDCLLDCLIALCRRAGQQLLRPASLPRGE